MGYPAPPSGPPTGVPTGPLGGQPAPLVAGGDYTSAFAPQEIEEAKVLSILGYLGILFLVPMLAMPNNRFARFHANQGLVLFITWFAGSIAQFALGYVPIIKWFTWILWLGPFVLMIIGMVNAGGGKAKALPLIGNFNSSGSPRPHPSSPCPHPCAAAFQPLGAMPLRLAAPRG